MTDLSPQAQVVLDVAHKELDLDWRFAEAVAAAALVAAADQVVPEEVHPQVYQDCCDYSALRARMDVRAELLTIAAELRGQEGSND